MYIERIICMSPGAVESTHLLRDIRVRAYVVVARSSVSCRRFQRSARGVDADGACCVGCRVVEWLVVVNLGINLTSYQVSACPRTTRFLVASNFLEVRAGRARRVRIMDERRAESGSKA